MKTFLYCVIVVLLSSCYVVRAYKYRNFELKDVDKFKAAALKSSNTPFHFFYSDNDHADLKTYLDQDLENTNSYAFLVIKNDSILYEKYFDGLDSNNVFPSFSVAKSFVSTLAQIAHQEGKIKSFQEPVTNYLPWLLKTDKRWENVSLQNVLDMRTGVKSDEVYNSPFSSVIKLGFTKNINANLKKLKIEIPPDKFRYQSVNTQILAAVIEAATKERLQSYTQKKLWQPLGMESDATWQTDSKGTVRAFCCLNATAKDFAKLGRLYLQNGSWDGNQILSQQWVQTILNADTMRAYSGYKNQWWSSRIIKRFNDSLQAANFISQNEKENWYSGKTTRDGNMYYSAYRNLPAVFAQGMMGQYIYINPSKNLIIVRLGHKWKHPQLYAQKFIEQVAEIIN